MDDPHSERSSSERPSLDATLDAPDSDRGAAPEALVRPGTLLHGRYEVESVLGVGGMGCVVVARHLELEQRVAIKLLLPDEHLDPVRSARLLREARAAARIGSEHVVRVFDVVTTGPHAPYIVMEFLEGESLARRLRRKGPLGIHESVEIVIQACEAVGEAHRFDIVHRDLKPANLQLVPRPGRRRFVKVLDFGISKMAAADDGRLTQRTSLLGSPAYSPPEQLESAGKVGVQADVWALGVVLYECLTGRLPFVGETLPDIVNQIFANAPPPPRRQRPEIPEGLERVVVRCLAKDPKKRFQSAEDLVSALAPFAPDAAHACLAYLRGLPDDEPPSSGPTGETETLHRAVRTLTATSFPVEHTTARTALRRRWVLGASLAALALGVVAVASIGLWKKRTPGDHASERRTLAAPTSSASSPVLASAPNPASTPADPTATASASPPSTNVLESARAVPIPRTTSKPRPARPAASGSAAPHATSAGAAPTLPPWVESR